MHVIRYSEPLAGQLFSSTPEIHLVQKPRHIVRNRRKDLRKILTMSNRVSMRHDSSEHGRDQISAAGPIIALLAGWKL